MAHELREEPLSPYYGKRKSSEVAKPVALSDKDILRALRLMLEGKICSAWDINNSRERDTIRREFRAEQHQIYPDHPHLVEEVLQAMLPGESQAHPPPPPAPPEPVPAPTSMPPPQVPSEPVDETSTAPTTPQSSSDEALAEVPKVQEGLRRIQQAMTIAHARGMTADDVYPHVDKLKKKYGIRSLPNDFIRPLLALWEKPTPEPEPEPPPQPHTGPNQDNGTDGFLSHYYRVKHYVEVAYKQELSLEEAQDYVVKLNEKWSGIYPAAQLIPPFMVQQIWEDLQANTAPLRQRCKVSPCLRWKLCPLRATSPHRQTTSMIGSACGSARKTNAWPRLSISSLSIKDRILPEPRLK